MGYECQLSVAVNSAMGNLAAAALCCMRSAPSPLPCVP
jgi:hypothetical protein